MEYFNIISIFHIQLILSGAGDGDVHRPVGQLALAVGYEAVGLLLLPAEAGEQLGGHEAHAQAAVHGAAVGSAGGLVGVLPAEAGGAGGVAGGEGGADGEAAQGNGGVVVIEVGSGVVHHG